jgi:hypothetical protein
MRGGEEIGVGLENYEGEEEEKNGDVEGLRKSEQTGSGGTM